MLIPGAPLGIVTTGVQALAASVVACFLVLSGLVLVSALFPGTVIGWLTVDSSLAGAAAVGALAGLRLGGKTSRPQSWPNRSFWTMPRIESLPPPLGSAARALGLVILRAYLLLAAAAIIAKFISLIGHS